MTGREAVTSSVTEPAALGSLSPSQEASHMTVLLTAGCATSFQGAEWPGLAGGRASKELTLPPPSTPPPLPISAGTYVAPGRAGHSSVHDPVPP